MIDLKHCTFLIPTLIDTNDRLQNILLIVKYLTTHFDTNILIGEQKNLHCEIKSQLEKHGLNHPSVQCHQIDIGVDFFHRSSIFNRLALLCKTKCLAIYDTDVLMLPEQYITACKQILEDKFDMIYPYDGHFHGVPKTYRESIYKSLDLKEIDLNICPVLHPESVGGAIIYNRDVFIKGGMENENFKGWGQEDNERFVRFQKLGYRQCRISGPLYHFTHEVQRQSSFYIPNSDYLNAQILYRIQTMTKEQLEETINNWAWCKNVK